MATLDYIALAFLIAMLVFAVAIVLKQVYFHLHNDDELVAKP